MTALYIRALQPDCFEQYKPIPSPYAPGSWVDDYAAYKQLSESKRSDGWRSLRSKYEGYFKAKESAEAENSSDMKFITEMYEHFKRIGLLSYAEKCRLRSLEFSEGAI